MMSPATTTTKMELLAPAGTLAGFEAAVTAGADAVYIGAPALNARALGRDFTRDEIAAMIAHAHGRRVKVYLAMNSLCKEEELEQAARTLAMAANLQADGLILQDLGIYRLARKYFPELALHASTLFGAHNSLAVNQFARMGFSRVVLARELSLKEIGLIRRRTKVELEVFVHGALCFSYSGLCLFSSYLGGKSGLRGRCVQPCRRRYTWTEDKGGGRQKSGYFFSMNDLSGLELLPELHRTGVASLKIEGRLRSAHYVEAVVKAYRIGLDTMDADESERAAGLREAADLIQSAMGRKTGGGYFTGMRPAELIAPYHSGNIGLFLGRVRKVDKQGRALLALQQTLRVGDRLRLHQEKTGERIAFTLKKMRERGEAATEVAAGAMVSLEIPEKVRAGDSIYKVDARARRDFEKQHSGLALLRQGPVAGMPSSAEHLQLAQVLAAISPGARQGKPLESQRVGGRRPRSVSLGWWLKIDDLQLLKHRLPFVPERVVVVLDRQSLGQFLRAGNYLRPFVRKLIWSLPPLIQEADLDFYGKAVRQLLRSGNRDWQLGHIGQLQFFGQGPQVRLCGDYTLNVLNTQALAALRELGLEKAQGLIEIDKHSLRAICAHMATSAKGMGLGLTVYGTPPLFTSRVTCGHFRYGRPLASPKGEVVLLRKERGLTLVLPERPFSLIQAVPELAAGGLAYVVVDLSHMRLKAKDLEDLGRQLRGPARSRRFSSFNYGGRLQ